MNPICIPFQNGQTFFNISIKQSAYSIAADIFMLLASFTFI